jgi:hypothetical protein
MEYDRCYLYLTIQLPAYRFINSIFQTMALIQREIYFNIETRGVTHHG